MTLARRYGRLASGPLAASLAAIALAGLPAGQQAVGSVFALAVAWWIFAPIPLPITSLVAAGSLVVVGVEERAALGAFGDPVIMLMIGSFILARSMELSGLGGRMAERLMTGSWASRSPRRTVFSFGAIACLISLFVSNTATAAMLLPLAMGIIQAHRSERRDAYAIAVLLMLTWGCSVAVGVPVGTPPNLIALSLIESNSGVRISFAQWAMFALPVTVLMLGAAWLIIDRRYRIPTEVEVQSDPTAAAARGPLTAAERNTMVAFFTALALWLAPDIANLVLGPGATLSIWLAEHLTLAVGAIAGATLLFVLRADGRPTITWSEAAGIDWGTVLLFGGGIALGTAMESSGLAASLGERIAAGLGAESMWGITALGIAGAILLSEIASNTASASILVPVVIGVAEAAGVSPIPPALGVGLGASLGFMMPISTPPNAIVYGSSLVPAREMMRSGAIIDVAGFVVTFVCLRLTLPWLGLT